MTTRLSMAITDSSFQETRRIFLDCHMGPSINYIITSEGGGGCKMMMVDDGRGEGVAV